MIFLLGCEDINKHTSKQSQPAITKVPPKRPIHRFVALSKFGGDVAFDSQTGQLCRTWDWQLTGKQPTPDPSTGSVPQLKLGQLAPTCLSLYDQYQSGAEEDTQIVLDEQTN